nr:glycosyltransferase family A protein [Myxacorys almedinensis]
MANADLKGLSRSLSSLAAQDPAPTYANEVILIDSGNTPTEVLKELCCLYPWVKIHEAQAGIGYYQSKMLGAKLATGEIIVYYDSDCVYAHQWLKTILQPFLQSKDVQIVAGETVTNNVGIYGTAMAMTYIFPPFSGQQELTSTKQYFLNNVAFRQDFLLRYPIPTQLPLYRGNCVIHAHHIREQGIIIWQQPQARAFHAPPNGVSHFFWRFLLIGHDYYWQRRLLRPGKKQTKIDDLSMNGIGGKLQIFRDRIHKLVANDLRHLFFLPLAIPIMIASALLIYLGFLITTWKPNYLLAQYNKLLEESQRVT